MLCLPCCCALNKTLHAFYLCLRPLSVYLWFSRAFTIARTRCTNAYVYMQRGVAPRPISPLTLARSAPCRTSRCSSSATAAARGAPSSRLRTRAPRSVRSPHCTIQRLTDAWCMCARYVCVASSVAALSSLETCVAPQEQFSNPDIFEFVDSMIGLFPSQDREEIGFNAQRSPVAHMSAPADGRAVPSASNAFAPLSNRASHGASVVNVPSPIMAVHWSQMQQMQKYQNAQNTQLMQHVRHFAVVSLLLKASIVVSTGSIFFFGHMHVFIQYLFHDCVLLARQTNNFGISP